ncbi:MAG TPA: L7Ae/L30e/S12e/Gadd45 family protein [Peptococcaceae bacterium]|nr:L7Ae/L30e/S12e/Gadd45 family protein [Peptococcaceae bacterium]
MSSKLFALLGMARRAGQIAAGESQVEALLKKRKGYLLILAEDSPGAINKFERWAKDINIPVLLVENKHELGLALGLSPRSAVLIMDRGFARAIWQEKNQVKKNYP